MQQAVRAMRFERKITLFLFFISFLYVFCAGGVLFWYIRAHPGGLIPRRVSIPIFCLFVFTIVIMTLLVRRAARKQALIETQEEGHLRRMRAIKGLKVGLIVWGVILLNDIRMLLERSIPWTVASAGSAVILLMIVATWVSLRRLQKAEAAGPDTERRQALQ